MNTGHIGTLDIEKMNESFIPAYAPLFSLFLGKSEEYEAKEGNVSFKEVETVGDVKAKRISPKTTELELINTRISKKTFNKYYHGIKYTVSELQSDESFQKTVNQVLDEHSKQFDEIFVTGDSLNNGLLVSTDSNYVLKASVNVGTTLAAKQSALLAKIAEILEDMKSIAGSKTLYYYGISDVINSVDTNGLPFKRILMDVLGEEVEIVKIPTESLGAFATLKGFAIVCHDQVNFNYTALPYVKATDINEEGGYRWARFLSGSSMLDVEAKGAVQHQPVAYV